MEEVKNSIIQNYINENDQEVISLYRDYESWLEIDLSQQEDRRVQEAIIGSLISSGYYHKSLILINEVKQHYKSNGNSFSDEEVSQLFLNLTGIHSKLKKLNRVYAVSYVYSLIGGGNDKILQYYKLNEKKIIGLIKKSVTYFSYIYIFVIVLRYALVFLLEIDLTSSFCYNLFLAIGLIFLIAYMFFKEWIINTILKFVNSLFYFKYW